MNRLFIVVAVCCALDMVLSCGNSDKSKADILQDSTEVKFSKNDTVVFGLAGAEGTDSILDLIVPGKDPQHFDIVEAKKLGNIIGNFDVGNQIAVVLSSDRKQVVKAIDISSLVGRWIKDGIESDSVAEGFSLSADGSAGTIARNSSNMVYTKWKISDANLVLAKQNIFQKDAKPECDTFDIVSLQGDTLLLGQPGQEKPIKYVYKEYPDSSKVAANSEKQ